MLLRPILCLFVNCPDLLPRMAKNTFALCVIPMVSVAIIIITFQKIKRLSYPIAHAFKDSRRDGFSRDAGCPEKSSRQADRRDRRRTGKPSSGETPVTPALAQ